VPSAAHAGDGDGESSARPPSRCSQGQTSRCDPTSERPRAARCDGEVGRAGEGCATDGWTDGAAAPQVNKSLRGVGPGRAVLCGGDASAYRPPTTRVRICSLSSARSASGRGGVGGCERHARAALHRHNRCYSFSAQQKAHLQRNGTAGIHHLLPLDDSTLFPVINYYYYTSDFEHCCVKCKLYTLSSYAWYALAASVPSYDMQTTTGPAGFGCHGCSRFFKK
jgi:hypothetical protein